MRTTAAPPLLPDRSRSLMAAVLVVVAAAGIGVAAVRRGYDRSDAGSAVRPSAAIWLDADDRVRRVAFTPHASDVVTVEFFDIGTPIAIDAPPSHQLRSHDGEAVDISDLVRTD